MPIDPSSIFGNIRTLADYQKAEEEYNLKRAQAMQQISLGQQQMATGQIDAETKKNTYAAQLLTAATATGDQSSYDAAKNHLSSLGVDTTVFAPDVKTGAQQAQALRLATSPLGTLFNAASQQATAQNAINIAAGITPTSTPFGTLQAALAGQNLQNQQQQTPAGIPTSPAGVPALPASVPTSPAGVPALPPESQPRGQGGVLPPPPLGAMPTPQTAPTTTSNVISFNPPPYDPTMTFAWNEANQKKALEAYKNNPEVIAQEAQAKARASEQGKNQAEIQKNLYEKLSYLPRAEQISKKLTNLADKATWSYAGQAKNWALQQGAAAFGENYTPEGAAARTNLISTVNDEILPLLRTTFGAQFTQKEGEGLKATLSDPNKSPEEKKQIVNAFIEKLNGEIGTLKRQAEYYKIPGYENNVTQQPIQPMPTGAAQPISIPVTGGNITLKGLQ